MTEKVKACYKDMIYSVSAKTNACNGFKFAVVTDSHLDNSEDDTFQNIRAVDCETGYRCLIHLGDFLNGNLPRHYTKNILSDRMKRYKAAVSSGVFYPVQGNHDGFADMITHQICNVALNSDWCEATEFIDNDARAVREKNKPYFYVDFKEEKLRFIILCTFYNEGNLEEGDFEKIYGTDDAQVKWFKERALDVDRDTTVLIFSHDTPFERFDSKACIDNPRPNGNELMEILKDMSVKRDFKIAAWFAGHFHGDYIGTVNGINFVLVGSQTAYVPALWDMPDGGYYADRELDSSSEDLWDSVVIDKENRKIRLFRFGAGYDRELDY